MGMQIRPVPEFVLAPPYYTRALIPSVPEPVPEPRPECVGTPSLGVPEPVPDAVPEPVSEPFRTFRNLPEPSRTFRNL